MRPSFMAIERWCLNLGIVHLNCCVWMCELFVVNIRVERCVHNVQEVILWQKLYFAYPSTCFCPRKKCSGQWSNMLFFRLNHQIFTKLNNWSIPHKWMVLVMHSHHTNMQAYNSCDVYCLVLTHDLKENRNPTRP